jgi:chromosome segregation ATPase
MPFVSDYQDWVKSLQFEASQKDAEIASLRSTIDGLQGDLAEAKAALAKYGDVGAFHALRDANARAERAEAALAEAKAALERYDRTFPTKTEMELHAALERAEAHYSDAVKDLQEWKGAASRAEAREKALREAITKIRAADNMTVVWHIAEGVLAPPPAGREKD